MFMMKSNLIYSNLYSLGSSANNARNFNKIWPGRLSRRRLGRGAPGKELFHQCGEMGGARKEVDKTPKRVRKLLIGKRN